MAKQTMTKKEYRERAARLLDGLAAAIVTDPDRLKQFGEAWRNGFHQYSPMNTMLLMCQPPSRKVVATDGQPHDKDGWLLDAEGEYVLEQVKDHGTLYTGYKKWRERHGRQVTKGMVGALIFVPWFKWVEDEDNPDKKRKKLIGFGTGTVFDVSQTDGDGAPIEIPMGAFGEKEDEVLAALVAYAKDGAGAHVEMSKDVDLTGGWSDGTVVRVNNVDCSNPGSLAHTTAHELGHHELKHAEQRMNGESITRNRAELEAECVAYCVCELLGLQTFGSAEYLGHWRATAEAVKDSAPAILRVASHIADEVAYRMGTKTRRN